MLEASLLIPASIVGYLVAVARLVRKLETGHQEYWVRVGSPSLLHARGQFAFVWKIVLANDMPRSIYRDCRAEIIAVRVLMLLGLIFLVAVPLLTVNGVISP